MGFSVVTRGAFDVVCESSRAHLRAAESAARSYGNCSGLHIVVCFGTVPPRVRDTAQVLHLRYRRGQPYRYFARYLRRASA